MLVLGPALGLACSSDKPPPERADPSALWAHSPRTCRADEVREYQCEALLPREASLPAPPPYETCPAQMVGLTGIIDPTPPVSVFDADYTEYMRKRAAPGHQCCYSWCSLVTVADSSGMTGFEGCDDASAFRETFCMDEPEGGTTRPIGAPHEKCPAAIVPPAGAVFAAPRAAAFDASRTLQQRTQGFPQCCYGWCSRAPAGSGMHKR